jgi:hypothetical protein
MMADLTPIWCAYCQAYVPAEREPHIARPDRNAKQIPHRAADQLGEPPPLPPPPAANCQEKT